MLKHSVFIKKPEGPLQVNLMFDNNLVDNLIMFQCISSTFFIAGFYNHRKKWDDVVTLTSQTGLKQKHKRVTNASLYLL